MNIMNQNSSFVDLRALAKLESGNSANLLTVIEKELIHYDIIRAMSENGFLESLCFQGGTSLRLCYGSERFSEDLDFTGGANFTQADMDKLRQCIEDSLSKKYGLSVEVKPPKENKTEGISVSTWQVKVVTAPDRPDIPSQKIKIEVANVPSYSRELVQIAENYQLASGAPMIIAAQSMSETMSDKVLALPASVKHIRYRDIWDLHWMSIKRVSPNKEYLNSKINDYGVMDFENKLEERIKSLPSIINGNAFIEQMSRFLRVETIEKTISNQNYRDALIGSVSRILTSMISDDVNHKSLPRP